MRFVAWLVSFVIIFQNELREKEEDVVIGLVRRWKVLEIHDLWVIVVAGGRSKGGRCEDGGGRERGSCRLKCRLGWSESVTWAG